MTLEELTAQRDALLSARYRGVRTVEMAAAMEAEMSSASIAGLVRRRPEPRGRRVFRSNYMS
jgi:hypothetical protein